MKRYRKVLLYLSLLFFILYRYFVFQNVIIDINDLIYYVFFYVRVDSQNMMLIVDVSGVFFWECMMFLDIGTYFRENLIANESMLYIRTNNRGKIFKKFCTRVIVKTMIFSSILLLTCFLLGVNRGFNSYNNIVYMFILNMNILVFVNVMSIILDIKYIFFIVFTYQYLIWSCTLIFKDKEIFKYIFSSYYVDSNLDISICFLGEQLIFFICVLVFGVKMLNRKEVYGVC